MSTYSDFWLKEYDIDWDFSENSDTVDISNAQSQQTANLIRLSAARRAVANYVSILTNKNIPVMFNDSGLNMTDGKTVYIGSDINENNKFDVTVGLALHEGSHICYTDFDDFKSVWQKIPRDIFDCAENLNISKDIVAETCRMILNVVEDRYIDHMVYKTAPGYRGYYQALYDKYFNSSAIDDGLTSKLYRTPSIDSYMYRLINITNKNTDLNALPGFYDIAKLFNLSKIDRLTTPNDRLQLSLEIARIIFKNITANNKIQIPFNMDVSGGDGDPSEGGNQLPSNNSDSSSKSDTVTVDLDDVLGGQETQVTSTDDTKSISDIGTDDDISKTKLAKIKKSFEKQKDFLNGKIKKKKVSKKENSILNILEQSKIDLVDVGGEYLASNNTIGAIECILVKNMTRDLVVSDMFPLSICKNGYTIKSDNPYLIELQKSVDAGISMGIKMAKRIQFRNEVNVDKFSRRETGKIDKRLIHEIGFDAENIFYTTTTNKYKKKHFHISIDASSSMMGEKWKRTMKLCTAIAKAASMLENIRVTISFRTTMDHLPYVVVAYDSNVDKFVKIKSLFAYLQPTGLTPEGLSYEAIMRVIPKSEDEMDSYFINISDGEPFFSGNNTDPDGFNVQYSGEQAANHTKHQVNKFRNMGYNIIAYFVSEYSHDNNGLKNLFKIMYGKDSHFINIENINQIVSTLNGKMLENFDV